MKSENGELLFKIDIALVLLYPVVVTLGFYYASLDEGVFFPWHELFALAFLGLAGVHLSLH